MLRFVDTAGHECAFYDTTLLFPTDVVDASAGVRAVDMSDPAHPVVTATLMTPAMLSPQHRPKHLPPLPHRRKRPSPR